MGKVDTATERDRLIATLLDELAAHTPAGMVRHLRRWPAGPLSLVHLNVLTLLDEEGPLPMRALADSLDVSRASTTGIVDRMEQRGLVERNRDEDDRRIVRVALTEAGRQLITGMATERRGRLSSLLDELTNDELDALLRGSRALRRARERVHASGGDGTPGRQGDHGSAGEDRGDRPGEHGGDRPGEHREASR